MFDKKMFDESPTSRSAIGPFSIEDAQNKKLNKDEQPNLRALRKALKVVDGRSTNQSEIRDREEICFCSAIADAGPDFSKALKAMDADTLEQLATPNGTRFSKEQFERIRTITDQEIASIKADSEKVNKLSPLLIKTLTPKAVLGFLDIKDKPDRYIDLLEKKQAEALLYRLDRDPSFKGFLKDQAPKVKKSVEQTINGLKENLGIADDKPMNPGAPNGDPLAPKLGEKKPDAPRKEAPKLTDDEKKKLPELADTLKDSLEKGTFKDWCGPNGEKLGELAILLDRPGSTAEERERVNKIIESIRPEELRQLSAEQMAGLTPAIIARLNPHTLIAMNDNQMQVMSLTQLRAMAIRIDSFGEDLAQANPKYPHFEEIFKKRFKEFTEKDEKQKKEEEARKAKEEEERKRKNPDQLDKLADTANNALTLLNYKITLAIIASIAVPTAAAAGWAIKLWLESRREKERLEDRAEARRDRTEERQERREDREENRKDKEDAKRERQEDRDEARLDRERERFEQDRRRALQERESDLHRANIELEHLRIRQEREKLEGRTAPSPLDQAKADAELQETLLKVARAKKEVDDLKGQTEEQKAKTKAEVAKHELAAAEARNKAADLADPRRTEAQKAKTEAEIADLRVKRAQAEQALTELTNPTPAQKAKAELEVARANADVAKAKHAEAKAEYETAKLEHPDAIKAMEAEYKAKITQFERAARQAELRVKALEGKGRQAGWLPTIMLGFGGLGGADAPPANIDPPPTSPRVVVVKEQMPNKPSETKAQGETQVSRPRAEYNSVNPKKLAEQGKAAVEGPTNFDGAVVRNASTLEVSPETKAALERLSPEELKRMRERLAEDALDRAEELRNSKDPEARRRALEMDKAAEKLSPGSALRRAERSKPEVKAEGKRGSGMGPAMAIGVLVLAGLGLEAYELLFPAKPQSEPAPARIRGS